MEARRGIVGGSSHGSAAIKNEGGVVRPSQLIASVGRTYNPRERARYETG